MEFNDKITYNLIYNIESNKYYDIRNKFSQDHIFQDVVDIFSNGTTYLYFIIFMIIMWPWVYKTKNCLEINANNRITIIEKLVKKYLL